MGSAAAFAVRAPVRSGTEHTEAAPGEQGDQRRTRHHLQWRRDDQQGAGDQGADAEQAITGHRHDQLPGQAGEVADVEPGEQHQQAGAEVGLLGDQSHRQQQQRRGQRRQPVPQATKPCR